MVTVAGRQDAFHYNNTGGLVWLFADTGGRCTRYNRRPGRQNVRTITLCQDSLKDMPLPDTMFCAQQIHIPPELPDILKQFTKAAIRTQPHDVLQWSTAYFNCLAKGEQLPVKSRVELPVATQKTDTGLTPGLLTILHKQLSYKIFVIEDELKEKWNDLSLPQEQLQCILALDNFERDVEWMKFLGLACSTLGGSITSALKHACEILTQDPEGGAARIPFTTFTFLYKYLAKIDGDISDTVVENALCALQTEANKQNEMIQPRNFLSAQCPPLS
ncbi:ropporin-1 [Pelobates cultripes]|uniref:Ropporin-1-like protein n=1 Tax=Pelobates cultripes TaxID=61616 RepID=A0AAD1W507_PELCU|nr:ropporin-1 [Pelobates cultripes]